MIGIDAIAVIGRIRRMLCAAMPAATLVLCSCNRGYIGGVRFENRPPQWHVDDRADTPEKPLEKRYYHRAETFELDVVEPVTYTMEVRGPSRAANVNAVGGVPDSTWYQNRIEELTPKDVAQGPGRFSKPVGDLRVISGKPAGGMPGFVATDDRDVRYLVKFDVPGRPELETGAEIVTQRLLWAAGYHVAPVEIVALRRDRIRPAPDGKWEDAEGNEHPVTDDYIEGQLAKVDRSPDGTYRTLVSRYLPGEPLGGYAHRGVRPDDPNDMVPHEDRRELRGQYVFFGWLAHTDVKTDNRLDIWVEDPRDPGRHFVMHYLVDFGKALGVMAVTAADPDDTWSYNFDYEYVLGSMFTLGLWKRPWEGYMQVPDVRGIGRFDAAHFQPGEFKPRRPYLPFRRLDPYDALWATEILLRIRPALVRAAVDQARYSDPDAADYMLRTLLLRRRIAARHWLGAQVNPLARFRIDDRRGTTTVCATNLWLSHALGRDVWFEHTASVHDYWGAQIGRVVHTHPDRYGEVCVPIVGTPSGPGAYTMVAFHTRRDATVLPTVWLHLARAPDSGRLRIIGVWPS